MTPSLNIAALKHDHVFLGRAHDENTRRTLWVVALTFVMMIGEIAAGSLFGSMALLADGFHMATHAGALAVAAGAYAFAKRNAANPRFSFGTGKVGDLSGFASALVLAVIAIGIAVESATRLIEPRPVAFDQAILVAVLGLIVNIVSALLLSHGHHHHHDHDHHGHDHHHHGPDEAWAQDNNLRSAYMHVLADALTSALAIIALIAGRYGGWVWLDPAMGIVGAVVIARWSWGLMRDTASVLLDTADPDLLKTIRSLTEAQGGIHVTDLHVWRIGPEAYAAIVSVAGAGTAESEAIRARLGTLRELGHITVECR